MGLSTGTSPTAFFLSILFAAVLSFPVVGFMVAILGVPASLLCVTLRLGPISAAVVIFLFASAGMFWGAAEAAQFFGRGSNGPILGDVTFVSSYAYSAAVALWWCLYRETE